MDFDEIQVARWLDPLVVERGDIADVFVERRRRTVVLWRDGEASEPRVSLEAGTSARTRRAGRERLAFVSGADDAALREAIRGLQASAGRAPLPVRPASHRPDPRDLTRFGGETPTAERWVRRLPGILARHLPRHKLRWTLDEVMRRVVPSGQPASTSVRRLFSLEGTFVAASKRGDEVRPFSFHAPEADSTVDELKLALTAVTAPRESPLPHGSGTTDVLFSGGTAAVLFHEILSHALEADAEESPLSRLTAARVSASELEVRDDPTRLDLFGGYERDDEASRPRPVKLLDSGRLGGKLADRAHAGPGGSTGHGRRAGPADPPLPRGSNTVVSAGSATTEEMTRRLANGVWIDEIESGTVELSSGQFRLRYPRARRVRRGRLADEVGPGLLAGEILPTLAAVEPVIGREVRACRSLAWCSRGGQVIAVGGAAPDVIVRRLSVRDR
ncbi:MAG TPA: metallopeptidase TldD-related protein [Thermoanaerobaculia bacterium]|jgi:predicted Zn-dependent protease|nr:metallopeptidase TldD-related protein [Thermoanaerobaculia bacterium]